MNMKFLRLILPSALAALLVCDAGSFFEYDMSTGDHLRIFTPCYNVVETFSPCNNRSAEISTSGGNVVSKEDYDLMAKIVYCESKGEPFLGKVAVASVILNRLYDPKFPKTVQEVIFQKNAFSCINGGQLKGEPDAECYRAVDEALNGNDPTSESIYFYNPKYSTSSWIFKCPKTCSVKIGNHIFFR